jgi:hypothetical protein
MKDLIKVKQAGRQAGIDWSKVKLANFSFDDKETVDAYKQATVTITIFGGSNQLHTLQYNAVQYDNRWYIYNGNLHWAEKQ